MNTDFGNKPHQDSIVQGDAPVKDNNSIEQYLLRRIKELNEADVEFCRMRWDSEYSRLMKSMAREESNKVTFARQELQQVLKMLNPSPVSTDKKK